MKKATWTICIIILVIALLISGFQIYKTLHSREQNNRCYAEIESECFSEQAPESIDDNENSSDSITADNPSGTKSTKKASVNFNKLQNINSNSIGWIYSPGTPINYPIVQGTDNSYYLNHLVNGYRNAGGAIFADYQNKPDFSDYNTVIYGHQMKNKSMFGSLSNYKKQSYYDNHKVMYLYTDSANYTLEIICGFYASSTSDLYLVPANAKLTRQLIDYGISNSTFVPNVTVSENDRIVTLSTCAQNQQGDRYVIMAKLVKQ